MAEPAKVVVVQGVAHGAVSQRGVGQGGFETGGQHGGLGVAAQVADIPFDYIPHRLHRPGQDYAQQVETRLVGYPDGIGGNVLIVGIHNPFRYIFGCAH